MPYWEVFCMSSWSNFKCQPSMSTLSHGADSILKGQWWTWYSLSISCRSSAGSNRNPTTWLSLTSPKHLTWSAEMACSKSYPRLAALKGYTAELGNSMRIWTVQSNMRATHLMPRYMQWSKARLHSSPDPLWNLLYSTSETYLWVISSGYLSPHQVAWKTL